MQFGKDMVLRLLIVDDSVEAAEAIVSALRNSGIAVRPTRPENEQELSALILQHPPDLVLAARNSRNISLLKLMQSVDASGKDLPVLVLMEAVDEAAVLGVMEIGARGIVLRSNISHLQNVVRAEWADLEARRSLRRLEAQVRETERRCDALIDSSRDPIAYIHEGMHIRANAAYLEIFGFESFDDIEGMSLLDLVAPSQVDGFKQLLKQLSKGEPPPPSYETQARALDGNAFPAVMEFTAATYEGEHCLQVVLRRQEIDPELAREVEALRQRDQVTGLLNRATFLRALEDAVSDAALYLPFGLLPGSNWYAVTGIVVLSIVSELAGVLGATLGAGRRYDGPMGKSDRAVVFGLLGLLAGAGVALDVALPWIWAAVALLLVVTIVNRVRRGLAERRG